MQFELGTVIIYHYLGYQVNQVLFTSFAILMELLSKMSSNCSSSLPLTFIVRSRVTKGSTKISNQLEAGSIHKVYLRAVFAFNSGWTDKVNT